MKGTFEELCADPAAAAWVVEALGATAKEERLKGFERVAAVGARGGWYGAGFGLFRGGAA
jgi:methylmalonyl-CoA mutase N-terminal domain/subunit